jgi:hypothetical protein
MENMERGMACQLLQLQGLSVAATSRLNSCGQLSAGLLSDYN